MITPTVRTWTDEEDKLLTQLWMAGKLAVEVAEALGRTKSSVIGRARRLGIPHPRRARRVTRKFGMTPGQWASRARQLPKQIEATRLKLRHLEMEARRYGMNELLGDQPC